MPCYALRLQVGAVTLTSGATGCAGSTESESTREMRPLLAAAFCVQGRIRQFEEDRQLGEKPLRPRRRPEDRTRPVVHRSGSTTRSACREVRLVGEDGEQIGIKTTDEAREYAYAEESRPRRGGSAGRPARRAGDGLREVPLRAGTEGEASRASTSRRSTSRRSSSDRRSESTTTRRRRATSSASSTSGRRSRSRSCSGAGRTCIRSAAAILLMRLAEDIKEVGQIEQPPLDGRPQHGHGARADEKRRSEDQMPKVKTGSGAKKRFKVSGTGKLIRAATR